MKDYTVRINDEVEITYNEKSESEALGKAKLWALLRGFNNPKLELVSS